MKLTLPGEKLGNELELASGDGTFVTHGEIVSMVAGTAETEARKAEVAPIRKIQSIEAGQEVIGQVMDIIEPVALIAIRANAKYVADNGNYGVLHVSNIKKGYLANIREALRLGDIILAKVVAVGKSIELTIKDERYGVISAYSRTGKLQLMRDGNMLKCPKTGNIEFRKLSSLYGKLDEVLSWQKAKK